MWRRGQCRDWGIVNFWKLGSLKGFWIRGLAILSSEKTDHNKPGRF